MKMAVPERQSHHRPDPTGPPGSPPPAARDRPAWANDHRQSRCAPAPLSSRQRRGRCSASSGVSGLPTSAAFFARASAQAIAPGSNFGSWLSRSTETPSYAAFKAEQFGPREGLRLSVRGVGTGSRGGDGEVVQALDGVGEGGDGLVDAGVLEAGGVRSMLSRSVHRATRIFSLGKRRRRRLGEVAEWVAA